MVAWARDEILKLLHPFMPFITEELWAVTAERDGLLVLAPWSRKAAALTPEQLILMSTTEPERCAAAADSACARHRRFQRSCRRSRDRLGGRSRHRDSLGARGDEYYAGDVDAAGAGRRDPPKPKGRAQRWNDVVRRMARLADISFADSAPEGAVQLLVRGEVAALPLKGVIDLSAEKTRLDKELAKAEADIKRVDAKLGNEKFVANAPEEIVEEEKEKREAAVARKARILEALERLKNAA